MIMEISDENSSDKFGDLPKVEGSINSDFFKMILIDQTNRNIINYYNDIY